jgi:hypothetical protein
MSDMTLGVKWSHSTANGRHDRHIVDRVCEILPPTPVHLSGPGVVRWAAGSETGPRSLTWRVQGVSNSAGFDDIYIGTRQTMNAVKISLHDADASGRPPGTLLAFTAQFAKARLLTQRRLATMGQTTPVTRGWRHELTIATPTTTFGTFPETPPLKEKETIQWWTPPAPPYQLSFLVYVGDADHDVITLSNHIGDVVQMPLTNGRRLWIVAQCEPMSDEVGLAIEEHTASLPTDPNLVHPFTMSRSGENGIPVLLDLASLYRPPNG